MTETAVATPEAPKKKRGPLLGIVAAALLGAGGFASAYLDFWSPSSLLGGGHAVADDTEAVEFVDVPTVELPIPGAMQRALVLSVSIETDPAHRAEVEHLLPRVSDVTTSFLSQIDPAAYDKRGVLEIIRAELVTRTRYVLGEDAVHDLLITEFRIK